MLRPCESGVALPSLVRYDVASRLPPQSKIFSALIYFADTPQLNAEISIRFAEIGNAFRGRVG